MQTSPNELEPGTDLDHDPRWLLVERIVASSLFSKSERLCSFLLFVCRLSLEGRDDEISEQSIGEGVFGRSANYDPSVDGIVRSHALRLRQRLEQFFAQPQESNARLELTIPRGAYIPVFSVRPSLELITGAHTADALDSPAEAPPLEVSDPVVETGNSLLAFLLTGGTTRRKAILAASTAFTLLSVIWTVLTCIYLATNSSHYERLKTALVSPTHPLWSRLFHNEAKTLIVTADSALVILQNLSQNRIMLSDYVSGEYRQKLASGSNIALPLLEDLSSRRYTSIVDVQTLDRFYRLPGVRVDGVQVKYARDVRPNDLKSGNVVLLGTYESTPWVQMYEPKMNFYFVNDLHSGVFSIINRAPQKQERSTYNYDRADNEHKIYGLVAFQPALSGPGDTLILEGQTMAGTEAATDFVFTDSYLLPFLARIKKPNGSIPHFELLIGSKSMSGNASQLEVIAYRVE